MKNVKIKAVEMVRKIRDSHYKEMKGKTVSERLALIHKRAEKVNEEVLHSVR